MKWLNIEIATLRSPAYIGADPVERATWLSLLGYCADQENGGRIASCKRWKDRQWQQVCGITASEAALQSTLWTWVENDIQVTFYPADKEEELRLKRTAGSKGGRASGKARREAQLQPVLEAELEAHLERKGKGKGKGTERNVDAMLDLGIAEPSQQQEAVIKRPRKPKTIDEPFLVELINDPAFDGIDVRKEHAKMLRWCKVKGKGATPSRLVAWLNRTEVPTKPEGQAQDTSGSARLSPWEIKQKQEAIRKQMEKIKSDYSNKTQSDEGWGYTLKPEAKAQLAALSARLKALDQQLME